MVAAEVDSFDDNETLLQQLDVVVAHKAEYQQRRHHRADSIRMVAHRQSGYERISTLKVAYDTYQRCLTDSVFCVLDEIRQTPEYATDTALQVWTTLCEARNLGVMGLYSSSFDLLRDIDPAPLCRELQLLYYNTMHAVTGWMVDFSRKGTPKLAATLADSASAYLHRVYQLEEDSVSITLILANILLEREDYQHCIELLCDTEHLFDSGTSIYRYAVLAQAYEHLGRDQEEIRYLTLTSIHDLQEGVTEYMALPNLAKRMQERGETDRAYNYLICSLEDAAICHSSLRAIESTDIFPIIDNAYRNEQELLRQSHLLTLTLIFVCIGLVIYLIVFYLCQHIRHAQSEVAQKKRHLAEMSYIADHDELTGLLNRHGGRAPIADAIAKSQPGYLGVLDIDFFKKVNDTFGHEVGDRVLRQVARCFEVMPQHIAARMGGDEFWIYTTAPLSEREYRLEVELFFEAIRAIRLPEMGDNRVSVSLGVAYYDGKHPMTFDDLYRQADVCLYRSKQLLGCALTLA